MLCSLPIEYLIHRLTVGTEVTVGNSGARGSLTPPNPMYAGAFDSAYYNSTNATGNLYVCGNTGRVPTLYAIHFTAGIPGSASSGATLATPGSSAACSPITDVPSPSQTAVQSERLFFSVQGDGLPLCASSAGCVYDLLDTPWQPYTPYAVGQRVSADLFTLKRCFLTELLVEQRRHGPVSPVLKRPITA